MVDDLFSETCDPMRVSWDDCSQVESPNDPFLAAVDREAAAFALGALSPERGQKAARYERIIRLSFGLYEGPALTLREIGEEMGISATRVGQMRQHAIRIMRWKLNRVEATGTFLWRFGPDPEPKPLAKQPAEPPAKAPTKAPRKKRVDAGRAKPPRKPPTLQPGEGQGYSSAPRLLRGDGDAMLQIAATIILLAILLFGIALSAFFATGG